MDYHMVVARKQVLVQLDDDLVKRLDDLAERLDTNRSELLRRGALAMLETEKMLEDDKALVAAYRRQPPDLDLLEASSRMAARTAPRW